MPKRGSGTDCRAKIERSVQATDFLRLVTVPPWHSACNLHSANSPGEQVGLVRLVGDWTFMKKALAFCLLATVTLAGAQDLNLANTLTSTLGTIGATTQAA